MLTQIAFGRTPHVPQPLCERQSIKENKYKSEEKKRIYKLYSLRAHGVHAVRKERKTKYHYYEEEIKPWQ